MLTGAILIQPNSQLSYSHSHIYLFVLSHCEIITGKQPIKTLHINLLLGSDKIHFTAAVSSKWDEDDCVVIASVFTCVMTSQRPSAFLSDSSINDPRVVSFVSFFNSAASWVLNVFRHFERKGNLIPDSLFTACMTSLIYSRLTDWLIWNGTGSHCH